MSKRTKDDIYRECATLFSNLGSDSTPKEKQDALDKEWELISELKEIDPEEYEFLRKVRDDS